MNDATDIWLIDAHTERNSSNNDHVFADEELVLCFRAQWRRHSSVVMLSFEATLLQFSGQHLCAFLNCHVYDGRTRVFRKMSS